MRVDNYKLVVGVILTVLITMLLPQFEPAQADGNGALGISYNRTLQGDVLMAGVGLRGRGTGNVQLSGIPEEAEIVDAFLYWATIGQDDDYDSPTLEDQAVDGTLIGTSGDTCWSSTSDNFVYRADVTDIVDGDGGYTVAGLPDTNPISNDSQGASLVVVYADPGEPLREIVIQDGAVTMDMNYQVHTVTLTGFIPDDPVTEARIGYIVGDGQAYSDGDVEFNDTILGTNLFGGDDGEYWDTISFDVTDLSPLPQSTTSINDFHEVHDDLDCLLWVATVFSVTTIELEPALYLPSIWR